MRERPANDARHPKSHDLRYCFRIALGIVNLSTVVVITLKPLCSFHGRSLPSVQLNEKLCARNNLHLDTDCQRESIAKTVNK